MNKELQDTERLGDRMTDEIPCDKHRSNVGKNNDKWICTYVSYYHPEGRSWAILGRKTVQHQSSWRWGEGIVGKGAGRKTENIIILLYKSMVHMCLECCMQSWSPREDVMEWEKVWKCWQESCSVTGGIGWEWEAGTELAAATGWNSEELWVRSKKYRGNRYDMTPLQRETSHALQLG